VPADFLLSACGIKHSKYVPIIIGQKELHPSSCRDHYRKEHRAIERSGAKRLIGAFKKR